MKALIPTTMGITISILGFSSAGYSQPQEPLQVYECRYEGTDSNNHRVVEVGHIITSEINGSFETRTLGMRRIDGPSAQIYAWRQGTNRKLYVALSDNQDATNYSDRLVEVGTPDVRVSLEARGAAVSLTCRIIL